MIYSLVTMWSLEATKFKNNNMISELNILASLTKGIANLRVKAHISF